MRELTGVIPVSLPLSVPPVRGRFGQVHKCVENSSGLTLAAKVIKARSVKEKVRELNRSNGIGRYCGELRPLGAAAEGYTARNVRPRKDGDLSGSSRGQLRPFIVSACLLLRPSVCLR